MLRVSERGGEFEGVEEKRQRRDGEFEAETGKSGGKKLPGHVQVLECEGKTSPVTCEINSTPITMTVNHTVILGFLPIMRFLNLLILSQFLVQDDRFLCSETFGKRKVIKLESVEPDFLGANDSSDSSSESVMNI